MFPELTLGMKGLKMAKLSPPKSSFELTKSAGRRKDALIQGYSQSEIKYSKIPARR